MRFRYLKDPLFLVCVVSYFANRFVFKNIWETGFVHEHFNDVICIPFWIPIMLWLQRRVGFRASDGPPEAYEIIIPVIIWSWVFEIILPATKLLGDLCVADYRDIFCYSAGALGASLFWNWWYADRNPT